MAIVIDSSIAVSWILSDEDSEIARMALAMVSTEGMIVPRIFWYEFRNSLLVNERRGRLLASEIEQGLSVLAAMNPEFADRYSDLETLRLSRQHDLSIYDAAYVDLALSNGMHLATLDKKMAKAAVAEGVMLVQ